MAISAAPAYAAACHPVRDNSRTAPPLPADAGLARLRNVSGIADDVPFVAGAALSSLHPIARDEHLLGALRRGRLALTCAARLAGQGGRIEDEAMLRDHWYLRQSSDDPGSAGRLLGAWRRLGTSSALTLKDSWPTMLPALLACRDDRHCRRRSHAPLRSASAAAIRRRPPRQRPR